MVLAATIALSTYTENTASNTTGITVANHDVSHTHSVSGTTGSTGSGTAYYQPYLVVNYIIKHD
jgi:microcystin-dependent protein